jgi:hypothetical protein
VVDVGGGTGGFMALLLSAHPHLTGVVLEQKEQVSSQHTSGGGLGLKFRQIHAKGHTMPSI